MAISINVNSKEISNFANKQAIEHLSIPRKIQQKIRVIKNQNLFQRIHQYDENTGLFYVTSNRGLDWKQINPLENTIVYPVPSKNGVISFFFHDNKPKIISVINCKNQELSTKLVNHQESIDFSFLKQDIYYVRISDGKNSVTKPILLNNQRASTLQIIGCLPW